MSFRIGSKVVCVRTHWHCSPCVQLPKFNQVYTVQGIVYVVKVVVRTLESHLNKTTPIGIVLREHDSGYCKCLNIRNLPFDITAFRPLVDDETSGTEEVADLMRKALAGAKQKETAK